MHALLIQLSKPLSLLIIDTVANLNSVGPRQTTTSSCSPVVSALSMHREIALCQKHFDQSHIRPLFVFLDVRVQVELNPL